MLDHGTRSHVHENHYGIKGGALSPSSAHLPILVGRGRSIRSERGRSNARPLFTRRWAPVIGLCARGDARHAVSALFQTSTHKS